MILASDSPLLDIVTVVIMTIASMMKRNLNLRRTFPTNVFSFDNPPPPPLGYHLPRPNFSASRQSYGVLGPYLLNVGSVDDIFRLDLWKKPSFLVCILGRPLTFWLLALAAAHWSSLLAKAEPFISLDGGESFASPFEYQPPLGCGEGLRESDM